MSTTFKPLADRVLIEPAAAEQVTASGIIIPDTAKEKPLRGKVIAVGNGKTDEPMNVNVGDLVIFGQYSGTEIKIDGANYLDNTSSIGFPMQAFGIGIFKIRDSVGAISVVLYELTIFFVGICQP